MSEPTRSDAIVAATMFAFILAVIAVIAVRDGRSEPGVIVLGSIIGLVVSVLVAVAVGRGRIRAHIRGLEMLGWLPLVAAVGIPTGNLGLAVFAGLGYITGMCGLRVVVMRK